jgi:opacity protein-like surface antigen
VALTVARAPVAAGLIALTGVASTAAGRAEAADSPEANSVMGRPHTMAIGEAGIIALPSAPISPSNRGGSTPLGTVGNGDATIETGLHLLYRTNRSWAFGAAAIFAPKPTSDPNARGASNLDRSHSRSYLFMGAEGRYFPFHLRWLEAWVGAAAGGVVISDRFTTNSPVAVPSFLGTNTVTVSTEGFALGVQAGADYLITDQWVVGLAFRADQWFLPAEKPFSQETSCDPLGDCPTLKGDITAFDFGITIGYQIPL